MAITCEPVPAIVMLAYAATCVANNGHLERTFVFYNADKIWFRTPKSGWRFERVQAGAYKK
jgi:hypothetical protein